MALPGLDSSFDEPQGTDTTSAPPMQVPQQPQPQQPAQRQAQGLAQALAQRKKKGLIGPTVRTPSTLAASISRAKRARQGADKYG